ncbi:MAG TPA: aspartate/glutamate racemase family protein [Thermodesulfobacteriota bacterium]|nr:aspartate/glutamate racemase family protein [Thermodesulfobacteriota bacterium]
MKICYLFPGIGMSKAELARRESILNRIAAQGTTVEVKTVEEGPMAIENAMDEYQAMPNILKFIQKHQDEYDALIIGCAGDAGLEGAREQARIPIAGPGESSLLLGTVGDKRFSLITTSLERAACKRKLVRDAGLDVNRLVSSHSLGIPVLEMGKDPKRTQQALIRAMKEAKSRGADVMVLGCMSAAFLDSALLKEAEREGGIPLINPIVTAVKMAEALVAMRDY